MLERKKIEFDTAICCELMKNKLTFQAKVLLLENEICSAWTICCSLLKKK